VALSADDIKHNLQRAKLLNFIVQTLLRSYEDAATDQEPASLCSTLNSVYFLLSESEKYLEEALGSKANVSGDAGDRPIDVTEVAELLRLFLQLRDDQKERVISKARELTTEVREDAVRGLQPDDEAGTDGSV
jgi:hypothetical protein